MIWLIEVKSQVMTSDNGNRIFTQSNTKIIVGKQYLNVCSERLAVVLLLHFYSLTSKLGQFFVRGSSSKIRSMVFFALNKGIL
mmetsp:Transcript_10678/g.13927  ORF Transcript_10678/g.13927 Transcript_10678/m.13927 type:complete len:83 (+) Transcript_10678:1288-1536(+)